MKALPLLLAVVLAGTASLRADLAHDISEKAVPVAKNQIGNGEEYAQSLYRIFTQNGIEAHIVQFKWSKLNTYQWTADKSGAIFDASFAVFRDSHGRYFGQQSTSVNAKWIAGNTPEEWAKSFYSNEFTVVEGATDNIAYISTHPAVRNQWASTY